ncbi:hypothetical protein AMS68_006783 [Peltaster fructicola]|uniref:Uncharacterized protein n=1 Tax=Peltaster fructicola TaxID=286661 RepID=A0A6H0Y2U1_9PEZI|nr:hypothetical protein AMS68_006783 [Peltaster fructicola]
MHLEIYRMALAIITDYYNCLLAMFWPLTSPRTAQKQRHHRQLSFFFLELDRPLAKNVVAGNNKAALFHLLACMSNGLYEDGQIFWGACGLDKTILVAFRDTTGSVNDGVPELVTRTMGDAVVSRPAVCSAPFKADVIHRDTLTIKNATLHLLMSFTLRRYAQMPGAWDAPCEAVRLPILDKEMILERYRVRPGSLRALEECVPRSAEVSDPVPTISKQEEKDSSLTSSGPQEPHLDDLDWVLIDDKAII